MLPPKKTSSILLFLHSIKKNIPHQPTPGQPLPAHFLIISYGASGQGKRQEATSNRTTHPLSMIKANAARFRLTSIDMSGTPTTTSRGKCGSSIQVVYNAVF